MLYPDYPQPYGCALSDQCQVGIFCSLSPATGLITFVPSPVFRNFAQNNAQLSNTHNQQDKEGPNPSWIRAFWFRDGTVPLPHPRCTRICANGHASSSTRLHSPGMRI